MNKQVVQIENIQAADLLARLDKIEAVILEIGKNKPSGNIGKTPDYITRFEVSKILRVSLVTLNDWTKKGLLTAYKCGNRVYYKRAEIENALTKKGGHYAG